MLTRHEIHTLIRVASQYGCMEHDMNILIHEEKDDGFVMQLIERHESEPDPENPLYFIKASDKYDGLVMLRVDVDNVNDLPDGQKATQIDYGEPDGQKAGWTHISPIPAVIFAVLYA